MFGFGRFPSPNDIASGNLYYFSGNFTNIPQNGERLKYSR
jgi:hypothetical protein